MGGFSFGSLFQPSTRQRRPASTTQPTVSRSARRQAASAPRVGTQRQATLANVVPTQPTSGLAASGLSDIDLFQRLGAGQLTPQQISQFLPQIRRAKQQFEFGQGGQIVGRQPGTGTVFNPSFTQAVGVGPGSPVDLSAPEFAGNTLPRLTQEQFAGLGGPPSSGLQGLVAQTNAEGARQFATAPAAPGGLPQPINDPAFGTLGSAVDELQRQANQAVEQGLAQGLTMDQIQENFFRQFGGKANELFNLAVTSGQRLHPQQQALLSSIQGFQPAPRDPFSPTTLQDLIDQGRVADPFVQSPVPLPNQGQFGATGIQGTPTAFGQQDLDKFRQDLFQNVLPALLQQPGPALRDQVLRSLGQGLSNLLPAQLSERFGQQLLDPNAGFNQLPFGENLSTIVNQISQGLAGAQPLPGQNVLDLIVNQTSPTASLPFGGNLQDLARGFETSIQTGGLGPGLTEPELEAQRNILESTLGKSREQAFRDLKAEAARRGLTTEDAPIQERLSRLDEELARQSGLLANQQLLEDMALRRAGAELGLQQRGTLADILLGARGQELQGADIFTRGLLGERGQERQFRLEATNLLNQLVGGERGLQAQQQSALNDAILRLILGQQGLGTEALNAIQQEDLTRQGFLGNKRSGLVEFFGNLLGNVV